MKLSSPAFAHEGNIPSKYTCDGENISPPLGILERKSSERRHRRLEGYTAVITGGARGIGRLFASFSPGQA